VLTRDINYRSYRCWQPVQSQVISTLASPPWHSLSDKLGILSLPRFTNHIPFYQFHATFVHQNLLSQGQKALEKRQSVAFAKAPGFNASNFETQMLPMPSAWKLNAAAALTSGFGASQRR